MLVGQLLNQAFENAISVLGESAANALIQDLTRHGIFMNDPALSLNVLADGVKNMVGEQAGTMIIERTIIEMDRLCASVMSE